MPNQRKKGKKQVNVWLPEGLFAAVDAEARRRHVPRCQIVGEIIRKEMRRAKSNYKA